MNDGQVDVAGALVAACRARGFTIATGESLTAGLVAARIADVPGASAVLRGGIVAYATDVKAAVLGVDPTLLGAVVSEPVALALADRARVVIGADLGIGTTGVAGPDPLDGEHPGTVWIAVSGAGARPSARLLRLDGDRAQVRAGTVEAALALALATLTEAPADRPADPSADRHSDG